MKIEIHIKKDESPNETGDLYKGDVKVRSWFDKGWVKVLSPLCCIISLIISGIALAKSCPKTNLEIDYLGAIVAIISLGVAIFIGVQIYHSFNLKRDIDEQNKTFLRDIKSSYNKQIKKKFKKWSNDNKFETLSAIYYMQGVYDYDNKKYEDALEHFKNSLVEGKKGKYHMYIVMVCDFLCEYESLVIHQNCYLNISDKFLSDLINGIRGCGYEKEEKLIEVFQKVRETNRNNKVK